MGLTCDGLATNRWFCCLHDPANKQSMIHKVDNPYTDKRYFYFFWSTTPNEDWGTVGKVKVDICRYANIFRMHKTAFM